MKIFFDHQTFSLQNYGGISRYYVELITGINTTVNNTAYLPLLFSDNIHLNEAGVRPLYHTTNINFYKKTQILYRLNKYYTIKKLKQTEFDVFHTTYYDPYFIPYLKNRPLVVTFLDMIHEKFLTKFPGLNDGGIITRQKQIVADRADRIIAISESTKKDIVNLLNVDPAKIDVIYLGNSLKVESFSSLDIEPVLPYLLFVGRRERYKNFEGLLKAIYPLLKKYKLKLVCAGGGAFSQEELKQIRNFKVETLVEQCSINDNILKLLYKQAFAFIFPTFYEGFGIPVLEAFACDCPCILSNSSSLPEVAGEAALYIDPNSSDSIFKTVETLLINSRLREVLIEKGRIQLKKFSWEITVKETLKVYQSII